MNPYKRNIGQTLNTDAKGVAIDRAFLAHFQVSATNATAGSATGIHAAIALTDAIQTVTTGITQPSVPRNITVKGNASGITGNVTIKGTNYNGDSISEVIALNGSTEVLGTKAFKTVSEIDLPVEVHAGTDTVSVGFGEVLGLPYKLAHNTVLVAYADNTREGTSPTVAVSTSAIESNTFDLNTALSGKVVDVYLIV